MKKYGIATPWQMITDIFDYLPLAALINNQVFCIGGGLSPNIDTIDQIQEIPRFQEI